MIVTKYGGSSVTCLEDLGLIRRITESDGRRQVIVVSAPGGPKGRVTDMLEEIASNGGSVSPEQVIERLSALNPELDMSEYKRELESRIRGTNDDTFRDGLVSFGEYATAKIIADTLGYAFLDPSELFVVEGRPGHAIPLPGSFKGQAKITSAKTPTVVPGFYGRTNDGKTLTFERGGSDITNAFLGACLFADSCEKYSDTPVLSAHPDIVSNPELINELTYLELRELSYNGFNVFHHDALRYLYETDVPLELKNFRNPQEPGTLVLQERAPMAGKPVVGVTYKSGLYSIHLTRMGIHRTTGVFADMLGILKDMDVSWDYMPHCVDSMSLFIPREGIDSRKLHELCTRIKKVVDVPSLDVNPHAGCLVVVGKSLRRDMGAMGRIYSALHHAGVQATTTMGDDGAPSLVLGVDEANGHSAVNAIYDEFIRS
ncbi:MAG: hypothetical protein ABIA93_05880 [Candidatus Woesearchaeota archaeon]